MSRAEDMLWVGQVVAFDNKRAFDCLVKKYQSPVRRFFLNLTTGDVPLSDDLAQDTFIKAYLQIGSFRGSSAFPTWIFRIAYNVFYDWTRTHKEYSDLNILDIDKKNSTENAFSSEKSDIFVALQFLKEDEKAVILLHYMEDKTHKEIARITNLPLGTVKTHLLKGKKKIETFLTKQGYGK